MESLTTRSPRRPLFLAVLVSLVLGAGAGVVSAGQALRGVVVDPAGVAVAGAWVSAAGDGWRVETRCDDRGSFSLAVPGGGDVRVVVRAAGFVEADFVVARERVGRPLRVALQLPTIAEQVTVTASRVETTVGRTPADVVVVSRAALLAAPALTLDETLRQVPGFTLFRRTGSLVANPTSQGVSLRAVGASGASRALVLDDGVPVNDPFGGWVYWDRVPSALLERVEVVRGGASDLYGSGAISGVVNLVRHTPVSPSATAHLSGGSMGTGRVSLAGGASAGAWTFVGGGEGLRTGGYTIVAPGQQGRVDRRAWSRHLAVDVSAARRFASSARVFLRGAGFGESRGNGTALQANNTRSGQLTAGAHTGWAGGEVEARAYGIAQTFNQSFSAITLDRSSEQLVRLQRVPSSAAGGSLQWARAAGRHRLVLGAEGRRVRGTTAERLPGAAGDWRATSEAGGTQASGAAFAGDTIDVGSSLAVSLSVRGDWWRNANGVQETRTGSGAAERRTLPGRSERAASPRAGVVYRVGRRLSLLGSAYRSFRAPTLNELYRSFRLGNVVTQANDRLSAERLNGVEAGGRLSPVPGLLVSVRGFSMRLDNPVANVTLSTTPALVLRQRQNLGRVASRGVEADAEARVGGEATLRLGYQFAHAVVDRFPNDPRLVGRRVPLQPRHLVTFGASLRPSWLGTVTVEGRWSGEEFEDDLNSSRLAPCFTLAAAVGRPVRAGLELVAAGENLLGDRCEVGRSPVTLLGAPRSVRVSARLTWGRVLH